MLRRNQRVTAPWIPVASTCRPHVATWTIRPLRRPVPVIALLMTLVARPATVWSADPPLQAWGQNVYQKINESLRVPGSNLYAEAASLSGDRYGGDGGFAYVWPVATQFRVLNALVRIDPTAYAPILQAFADELHARYWRNGTGAAGGYRSGVSSGATLFYDDNGHLVVSLAEAYNLTGEPRYLDRAIAAYNFVISGEDLAGGGGIYFSVPDRSSKDAISTLQAVRAALLLYPITGQTRYLDDATRLYAWAASHIQQSNGLFKERFLLTGSNAGTSDGHTLINSAGIGISCNLLFYDATGTIADLREAQRIGRASVVAYFTDGAIRDEGYWAFELVDALDNLYLHDCNPTWLQTVVTAMTWLHTNREDPNGHYGRLWSRDPYTPGTIRTSWELNDQAAVARSYLYTAATVTTPRPFVTAADDTITGFYQGALGGNHVASSAGSGAGQYPATQPPAKAIDDNATTKYLNYGNGSSATTSPTKGVGTGFCITPAATIGASIVTGIQIVTAGDTPSRDPLTVSVEGTSATGNFNLGSTWTPIADNVNLGIDTDPGRQSYGPLILFNNDRPYRSYRVMVKSQRGIANSVQYAEMRLVGTPVDLTPPGPVAEVTTTTAYHHITLSWTNPADPDFAGTRIVFKTTGYPTGPTDGTLLTDQPGVPDARDQYVHAGADCNTPYYYAIFAYDAALNYAPGPATPVARIQCSDFDVDSDVDLDDFAFLQRCLSGNAVSYALGCASADLDADGDADPQDLRLFYPCLTGPDQPPGC